MRRSKQTKNDASVATYGDHEVIIVENKLRTAVRTDPFAPDDEDPIRRAEQALAELSSEFGSWMGAECDRLDAARREAMEKGLTEPVKNALFQAAHDIKGQAATFGYPAVGLAAAGLCKLIDLSPDASRIPMRLIEQHVDAVRAIFRDYARSDMKDLSAMLTRRLREVTDDFLINENRGRHEVLEQIKGPSVAPE
jgi:HPt (histidine-containing phosphotransfer) domain-containing protein